jgi:ribosomal protein S4E
MKTLIENSIKIYGMGHPDTKTVFNIEKEEDRNHLRFKSLTTISGRKLTVWFKYAENDVETQDKLQMTIIKSVDENEIKDFILAQISSKLAV